MAHHLKNTLLCKKTQDCTSASDRTVLLLWNVLLLVLSSMALCVLSLSLSIGYFDISYFYGYFLHPLIFLLNWLPFFLMQVLLYCVFGIQWISFMITMLFFMIASIGNYYKLKFRCEPFTYDDITMITTALGVANEFDLTPNIRIIFAVAASFAGCVLMGIFAKWRPVCKTRLLGLLAVCIAVLLLVPVYSSTELYKNKATYYTEANTNTPDYTLPFVKRGFVYPFIYSVFHNSNQAPEDYDEALAESVICAYSDADIPEDKKVNVIAFQLESFSDLRTLGITGISDDVYSYYDTLLSETYHGQLITDTFGGGTIITEHSVITGETTYVSPPKNYPSYAWYFHDQGYTTVGNHPNNALFYHRGYVNQYLGFESYRYSDNYYENLIQSDNLIFSDELLFDEILKEYQSYCSQGQNVFSFNITYQGHGEYSEETYGTPSGYFENDGCSAEACDIMNRYLYSVNNTLTQMEKLLDSLRNDAAPVVVVFYGDHKPNLTYYDELGVTNKPKTQEGIINYFATEYVIWANDAAKQTLCNDFTGEGPAISPCFLMPLLFGQLGWEGNAYCQYMSSVMEVTPVINTKGYYLEDGLFTVTPGEDILEAADLQKMIQYYLSSTFTHD